MELNIHLYVICPGTRLPKRSKGYFIIFWIINYSCGLYLNGLGK